MNRQAHDSIVFTNEMDELTDAHAHEQHVHPVVLSIHMIPIRSFRLIYDARIFRGGGGLAAGDASWRYATCTHPARPVWTAACEQIQ